MPRPILYWFRNDLRIDDNPAFSAAAASGRPLIACYILDEQQGSYPGAASRWWLHHSLQALDSQLGQLGGYLVLVRGQTLSALARLAESTDASALYFSRQYDPHGIALEQTLHKEVINGNWPKPFELCGFAGYLLFEPRSIGTQAGSPFKVFTPFWRACMQRGVAKQPLAAPQRVGFARSCIEGDKLDDWRLIPVRPNWAKGFESCWQPGSEGAKKALEEFLEHRLCNYAIRRDKPAVPGTSRLSPHLHFGEISPRQVWHSTYRKVIQDGAQEDQAEHFLREVIWREFCHHLLFHWSHLAEQNLRENFNAFPWRDDSGGLQAWQKGRTGFPIVDAGMRELWHTGWMHNRVRMITASFLVKDLLIPWQRGERWFWETLVDADLASNAANWQWVAGSGADAAPYFRIFNPVTQGQKFDPEGEYVRRWLPELARLPAKFLHCPWLAPKAMLSDCAIELGRDYPLPIVDHKQARERALAAFQMLKMPGNP